MENIAFIHDIKADTQPLLKAFNSSSLSRRFTLRIGPDLFNPIDDDTCLILCAKKNVLDKPISELNLHPHTTYREIPTIFLSDDDQTTKELIIRAVDFEITPNNTLAYKNFFDRLAKKHFALRQNELSSYDSAS